MNSSTNRAMIMAYRERNRNELIRLAEKEELELKLYLDTSEAFFTTVTAEQCARILDTAKRAGSQTLLQFDAVPLEADETTEQKQFLFFRFMVKNNFASGYCEMAHFLNSRA